MQVHNLQQTNGHIADGGGNSRVIRDGTHTKKPIPIVMVFDEEKKQKELKETKLTQLKTFLVIADIYMSSKYPHLYPTSSSSKKGSTEQLNNLGSTLRASSSSGSISMMDYNGSDFDTLFNGLETQPDSHKKRSTDSPKIIPKKQK